VIRLLEAVLAPPTELDVLVESAALARKFEHSELPVVVDEATHAWLVANPGVEVEIDLATTTLRLPDGRTAQFPVEAFARYCLLHGVDELGFLLNQADAITAYEQRAG